MARIAFFELEGWEEEIIRNALDGNELFLSKEKIKEFSLPSQTDFEIISIFVDSRLDESILARFPNLRFIATRSTGFDHIDLAAAKKRAIAVSYVPGYGSNTVAEFTFGLILNLTRKIYQSINQVKETGSFSLTNLRGVDLKDKTLGVVGTGKIGREVIKLAKAFSMKVIAYTAHPDTEFAKQVGFEYTSLDHLLQNSDIISLHCAYNKETHHLINKENIQKIKKGAFLINTARGPIVQTEALVMALSEGRLAGAGLDVLEEEGETEEELAFLKLGHPKEEELKTILHNHILMKMPNVLITPHNAFNTQEALQRILQTTIENIKSFLAGKPINIVP
jgi:D-lactate dehydrogenase